MCSLRILYLPSSRLWNPVQWIENKVHSLRIRKNISDMFYRLWFMICWWRWDRKNCWVISKDLPIKLSTLCYWVLEHQTGVWRVRHFSVLILWGLRKTLSFNLSELYSMIWMSCVKDLKSAINKILISPNKLKFIFLTWPKFWIQLNNFLKQVSKSYRRSLNNKS